jgi:hypothetical protein
MLQTDTVSASPSNDESNVYEAWLKKNIVIVFCSLRETGFPLDTKTAEGFAQNELRVRDDYSSNRFRRWNAVFPTCFHRRYQPDADDDANGGDC